MRLADWTALNVAGMTIDYMSRLHVAIQSTNSLLIFIHNISTQENLPKNRTHPHPTFIVCTYSAFQTQTLGGLTNTVSPT